MKTHADPSPELVVLDSAVLAPVLHHPGLLEPVAHEALDAPAGEAGGWRGHGQGLAVPADGELVQVPVPEDPDVDAGQGL